MSAGPVSPPVFEAIRSATEQGPYSKVASFLEGMQRSPPQSRPASNIGDDHVHQADEEPDSWVPISMRGGPQVRPSADAEATQSLWEEIDDKGDGIDWENISNQQQKSPRASKMAVNNGDKTPKRKEVRDSTSTWGNVGPLPDAPTGFPMSTAYPMTTPYRASNVPLPPTEYGRETPDSFLSPVAPQIHIVPPTDPNASRNPSRPGSSTPAAAKSRSVVDGGRKSRVGTVYGQQQQYEEYRTVPINEVQNGNGMYGNAPDWGEEQLRSPQAKHAPSAARSRAASRADRADGVFSPPRSARGQIPPSAPPPAAQANTPTEKSVPINWNDDRDDAKSDRTAQREDNKPARSAKAPSQFGGASQSHQPPAQTTRAPATTPAQSPVLQPMAGFHHTGGPSQPARSRAGHSRAQSRAETRVSEAPAPALHPLSGIISRPPAGASDFNGHASQRGAYRDGGSRAGGPTQDITPTIPNRVLSPTPSNPVQRSHQPSNYGGGARTPTAQHPQSPDEMEREFTEQELVDLLRTPRTNHTVTPSALADEVNRSQFHDETLCVLLHAADDQYQHEVVKKAVRKAVKARIQQLGLDQAAQERHRLESKHHHQANGHHQEPEPENLPAWAISLKEKVARLEAITALASSQDSYKPNPEQDLPSSEDELGEEEEYDDLGRSHGMNPRSDVQTTGTRPNSVFVSRNGGASVGEELLHGNDYEGEENVGSEFNRPRNSGEPIVEEKVYALRTLPSGANPRYQVALVVQSTGPPGPTDQLPEIQDEDQPDMYGQERREAPLPPLPIDGHSNGYAQQVGGPAAWPTTDWSPEQPQTPPWQRIHQHLLSCALVWPMSELDSALASTDPGHQADEIALSIWVEQVYKRYVRAKHFENPPGRVDRLFVPPNIAHAINVAVQHGRVGDARNMLRDLWNGFGLEGMPRIILALARHRHDHDHYVVHRFGLPEGSLTTYDTFPGKSLVDSRPVSWWLPIRAAWPNAIYSQPDHMIQRTVKLPRPLQLQVDNSISAAAMWRNLLMGSKAERGVDLVRLRDLMHSEVKNLMTRKEMGRLSVGPRKSTWEEIGVA